MPHELPESYGRSRVVVLPIDPYHLHAYWEITAADAAAARGRLDRTAVATPIWVLRFYDVTHTAAGTASAHAHFDVEIDLDARNWYIELWSPDKSYVVELGARVASAFTAVCTANPVTVPPGDLSPQSQPEWRTADPEHTTTHAVEASDPRLPATRWASGAAGPETARSGFEPSADGEQPWLLAVRGLGAEPPESPSNADAPPTSKAPPTLASTPQALALGAAPADDVPLPGRPREAHYSRSVSLQGGAAQSGGSAGLGGDSSE